MYFFQLQLRKLLMWIQKNLQKNQKGIIDVIAGFNPLLLLEMFLRFSSNLSFKLFQLILYIYLLYSIFFYMFLKYQCKSNSSLSYMSLI